MILAMDIGNTNVKYGVFDGDKMIASWRVSTKASRTADEYGMVLYDLLRQRGVNFEDIDACVMSSVAPALNYTIEHMCNDYIGKSPLIVSSDTDTGITLDYAQPTQLGTDRIVGAAAAYAIYGGPVIVVDFGNYVQSRHERRKVYRRRDCSRHQDGNGVSRYDGGETSAYRT